MRASSASSGGGSRCVHGEKSLGHSGCPGSSVLAGWHSHPLGRIRQTFSSAGEAPLRYCSQAQPESEEREATVATSNIHLLVRQLPVQSIKRFNSAQNNFIQNY